MFFEQPFLNFRPQGFGNIRTRARRAFLTSKFKRRTNGPIYYATKKSSSYSRYYAEACNEWRSPSPRLSARPTQLRRKSLRWRADGDSVFDQTSPESNSRSRTLIAIFLTKSIAHEACTPQKPTIWYQKYWSKEPLDFQHCDRSYIKDNFNKIVHWANIAQILIRTIVFWMNMVVVE